jgi:hypothetical protein
MGARGFSCAAERRSAMKWKKSSYCGYNGDCVEVAAGAGGVLVRDSKNPSGPVLAFTPGEWREFLRSRRPPASCG